MPSHRHSLARANSGSIRVEEIGYSNGGSPQSNTTGVGFSGGGQAHNNMQPYNIANYLIKF